MPATEPAPPAGKRQASLRNILLNAGWMLGGKGVAAVLSLVYLAIVTRSLGVEGFGQFSLTMGVAQAVQGLVAFQSWQIIVRYGMPHLHAGRREALARVVRFALVLDVATALLGALLATLGLLLIGRHFGWSAGFVRQAIWTTVPFVLAMHWTPIGVLRLQDRFATAALCDSVTAITRFLGAITVWLTGASVIGFLAAWAVAEVLTAIAYWAAATRTSNVSWRLTEPLRWATLRVENPGIAGYALTTNLSATLDLGGRQLAVLLVGLVVTPAAAGGFRLAQQLASAVAKLSQILTRAIFPELVRSHGSGEDDRAFDRLFRRTVRMTAAGGAIVFVLLLLIGKPVLGLIAGKAFLSAYPLLLVLGTAAAIDFAAVGFEPAVVALGRPGLALRLRFLSTATLLTLMLLLPLRFGALGAGFAILAGSLLSFTLLWRVIRGRVRKRRR